MPVNSLVLAAALVSAEIIALSALAVPPAAPKPVPQAKPAVPVPVPVMVNQAAAAQALAQLQLLQGQLVQIGRIRRVRAINNVAPAPSAQAADDEESVLKLSCLKTTDQALLDFFRKRTLPTPRRNVLEQLAQTLASPKPEEADAAQAELVSLGTPTAAILREIANCLDNPAAAQRAKQILHILEGPLAPNLPIEIARLLAARKPAGAVEILLDYLAVADNDNVIREVVAALAAIGCPKGQVDPAITAALHSPQTVRRAAAAQILCQVGGTANLTLVRPLMKDSDPTVRFKATLALADAYDNEAIPVLIDLMGEAPSILQAQVEKYLTELAGEFAVHGPKGQDALSRQLRYRTWSTWWKYTDGPHLLQAFQAHTLTDEELEKAQKSLAQLGALGFKDKESAMRDLIALGRRVIPLLRRAVQQEHAQISPAAEQCLSSIESEMPFTPLPEAALRLLQLRRPAGTVAALVAYLPFAEDEAVERIQEALIRTGVVDGKPDAALVQALQSKIGRRRSVAATALCRGHATEALVSVRPLLEDKDLDVRQQVAQEMALAGDKEAVGVLIGMLDKLSGDRVWVAEDCLEKLAGNKAPAIMDTGDEVAWAKVGEAWLEWWKGDKSKVAMKDATNALGLTMLIDPQSGTITEVGRDGKPRWSLNGLRQPCDAQVLPNGHVLVAEQGGGCVTERDKKGKILWEKQGLHCTSMQRLPNGNIFLCSQQLVEVDRKGNEVQRFQAPLNVSWKSAARKLRDGRVVLYTNNPQMIVQFDKAGRVIKQSPVPMTVNGFSAVLDNGHVIGAAGTTVIECDIDGKEVHRFEVAKAVGQLFDGCRLPNGHTLVLGNIQGQLKCIELDKSWKRIVKETPMPGQPNADVRVRGR